MEAPGTTAPEASVTVPFKFASSTCAKTGRESISAVKMRFKVLGMLFGLGTLFVFQKMLSRFAVALFEAVVMTSHAGDDDASELGGAPAFCGGDQAIL